MEEYLKYLKESSPAFYEELMNAGGVEGAKSGSKEFIDTWQQLAKDYKESFDQTQYEFIRDNKFGEVVDYVNQNYNNLDLTQRDKMIKEAIWSMGVQHSLKGNQIILNNAFNGKDLSKMTNKQLLREIYKAREQYVNDLPGVELDSNNRYVKELERAIEQLKINNK